MLCLHCYSTEWKLIISLEEYIATLDRVGWYMPMAGDRLLWWRQRKEREMCMCVCACAVSNKSGSLPTSSSFPERGTYSLSLSPCWEREREREEKGGTGREKKAGISLVTPFATTRGAAVDAVLRHITLLDSFCHRVLPLQSCFRLKGIHTHTTQPAQIRTCSQIDHPHHHDDRLPV